LKPNFVYTQFLFWISHDFYMDVKFQHWNKWIQEDQTTPWGTRYPKQLLDYDPVRGWRTGL